MSLRCCFRCFFNIVADGLSKPEQQSQTLLEMFSKHGDLRLYVRPVNDVTVVSKLDVDQIKRKQQTIKIILNCKCQVTITFGNSGKVQHQIITYNYLHKYSG